MQAHKYLQIENEDSDTNLGSHCQEIARVEQLMHDRRTTIPIYIEDTALHKKGMDCTEIPRLCIEGKQLRTK